MTDPLPPLTDGELSAVIDGEASPAIVARAAADPDAQARLGHLRQAALGVGQPVQPLPEQTVDALIGRALQAHEPGSATQAATEAAVAPLVRRRGPAVPGWLVAAAVLVLVAVGLGLVWSGRDQGATQTANGQRTQTESAADSRKSSSAGTADSAAGGVSTTVDPAVPPHGLDTTTTAANASQPATGLVPLGSFASADALREALKTSFPAVDPTKADPTSGSLANLQVDRCRDQLKTILSITSQPTHVGVGTVAGKPVLVYEFATKSVADGTATTLVAGVGQTSCDPVVTFER